MSFHALSQGSPNAKESTRTDKLAHYFRLAEHKVQFDWDYGLVWSGISTVHCQSLLAYEISTLLELIVVMVETSSFKLSVGHPITILRDALRQGFEDCGVPMNSRRELAMLALAAAQVKNGPLDLEREEETSDPYETIASCFPPSGREFGLSFAYHNKQLLRRAGLMQENGDE